MIKIVIPDDLNVEVEIRRESDKLAKKTLVRPIPPECMSREKTIEDCETIHSYGWGEIREVR